MKLEFDENTPAKVRNVNLRGETHGDKVVPAFDLALSVTVGNEVLDAIGTGLRACLFEASAQLALDGGPDMATLRFPALGPLHWKEDDAGYELLVNPGPGADVVLLLRNLRLGPVTIKPLEGGSVELDFRCQSTDEPDRATLGVLGTLVQQQVRIGLVHTPPAV